VEALEGAVKVKTEEDVDEEDCNGGCFAVGNWNVCVFEVGEVLAVELDLFSFYHKIMAACAV
jgi:hypothetical protein